MAYTKNVVIDNLRVQRRKLEGQIDAIKTVCKENQGELAREILEILGSSEFTTNSEEGDQ